MTIKPCVKCGATERNARGQCKPCARAAVAKWRSSNPDKVRSTSAKYQANNTDKIRAYAAQYHTTNAGRERVRRAKWRASNPEACRISSHNRRARKLEAGGKLSKGLSGKLFKLQRGLCPCCKKPLGDDYHLDHVMPLFLGGKNEDWNMQLLRQRCNQQKHAKHPVEFMQGRGYLL